MERSKKNEIQQAQIDTLKYELEMQKVIEILKK